MAASRSQQINILVFNLLFFRRFLWILANNHRLDMCDRLALREPSLLVLLNYARAAGVYLDVLVDDELDLPERLPARPKSEGKRSKVTTTGTDGSFKSMNASY